MMVAAPATQFLGHAVYAAVDNAIATPIVLPRLDLAHATNVAALDTGRDVAVTDPALSGVSLQVAAGQRPRRQRRTIHRQPVAHGLTPRDSRKTWG